MSSNLPFLRAPLQTTSAPSPTMLGRKTGITQFLPSRPVHPNSARGTCSKCGRCFKCLNKHLRVSATCHDVTPTQPSPDMALPSMNFIPKTTAATTNTIPAHHFKHPRRLPRNPGGVGWAILSAVAAASLQVISAEEKNSCLCGGIYEALANRFGTMDPKLHQAQAETA